jgi:hypothetical protein
MNQDRHPRPLAAGSGAQHPRPVPAATDRSAGTGGAPAVAGAVRVHLESFEGPRGRLSTTGGDDGGDVLSFLAARYFVITEVPAGEVRGGHANMSGVELLTATHGSCVVETWWAGGHRVDRLSDPGEAVEVRPWTWVECRDFSADAALLVLCSMPYDPADQLSDPAEFESRTGAAVGHDGRPGR